MEGSFEYHKIETDAGRSVSVLFGARRLEEGHYLFVITNVVPSKADGQVRAA